MFNSPGMTQAPSFTVYPTALVVETLAQHSTSQDRIDYASTEHALRNFGSTRCKARALIRASEGNQSGAFSVY